MAEAKKAPPRKPEIPEPVKAKDIKAQRVKWFWQDRIPEAQIVIVGGRPDGGKGLFAAHVTAALSNQGRNILYSAIEDSPEQLTRPRLEAAGADLNNVLLYRFTLPGEFDEMAAKVLKHKIALVIVDPISGHLDKGVSKFTDSIRRVTTPMQKLCERTGVTFLLTDHVTKKVAKDAHPLMAIGGASSGLPAAARMAFLFGKDPADNDRMILAPVKHNLRSKPEALSFEQDSQEVGMVGEIPFLIPQGECSYDPMKLLVKETSGKKGRRPEKLADANEWVTGHLATYGPMKSTQLYEDAKHAGIKRMTLRRAIEDMGVVKSGAGGRAGHELDLPDALKALLRGGGKDGK